MTTDVFISHEVIIAMLDTLTTNRRYKVLKKIIVEFEWSV